MDRPHRFGYASMRANAHKLRFEPGSWVHRLVSVLLECFRDAHGPVAFYWLLPLWYAMYGDALDLWDRGEPGELPVLRAIVGWTCPVLQPVAASDGVLCHWLTNGSQALRQQAGPLSFGMERKSPVSHVWTQRVEDISAVGHVHCPSSVR